MSDETATTIGIPQLIVAVVLGAFLIRWLLSTPTPSTPSASSNSNSNSNARTSSQSRTAASSRSARRITPAMVEVVQAMFPQVSAAAIRYDLERNGGSIESTTERILAEGTLREPPAQSTSSTPRSSTPRRTPRTSTPANAATATATTPAAAATSSKPLHSDLITRYSLQERLKTFHPDTADEKKGKAAVKNDRGSLLIRGRARRDEMILRARKSMEERLANGELKQ